MIILTLRSDQEMAHLGLFDERRQLATKDWQAGRQLAETLHATILDMLSDAELSLDTIQGIVGYKGPGSFTGLRIGLTTANTLAYSLTAAIVGTTGEDWELSGVERLLLGANDRHISPEYGSPVHITLPKK